MPKFLLLRSAALRCMGIVRKGPTTHPSGKTILRGQAVGFLTLIGLMWAVEAARLPHYLFGESPEFIWTRVLSRTATVLLIWLPVHLTTKRLLRRLHELEDFLQICSWCRKVGHQGEWLLLEEYFDSKFHTGTSHGICPECVAKQIAMHRDRLHCEAAAKPAPGGA